jgi:hypothetical protein
MAKKMKNPLRSQHIMPGEGIARANLAAAPQATNSRFRHSS